MVQYEHESLTLKCVSCLWSQWAAFILQL